MASQFANDFNYCNIVGTEYMDIITTALFFQKGISLNAFCSKKYQMSKGESLSGIEIKHDSKYTQTGNFYFETKAIGKDNQTWLDGGIMHKDNTWLYIIGTDKYAYAFSKKYLQALYLSLERLDREQKENYANKTGIRITSHYDNENQQTSYGMIIPLNYAKQKGMILFELDLTKGY